MRYLGQKVFAPVKWSCSFGGISVTSQTKVGENPNVRIPLYQFEIKSMTTRRSEKFMHLKQSVSMPLSVYYFIVHLPCATGATPTPQAYLFLSLRAEPSNNTRLCHPSIPLPSSTSGPPTSACICFRPQARLDSETFQSPQP